MCLWGGGFIKNIAFQIEDELHMQIKLQATKEGKSIKDYILELIKIDIEKKEQ